MPAWENLFFLASSGADGNCPFPCTEVWLPGEEASPDWDCAAVNRVTVLTRLLEGLHFISSASGWSPDESQCTSEPAVDSRKSPGWRENDGRAHQ